MTAATHNIRGARAARAGRPPVLLIPALLAAAALGGCGPAQEMMGLDHSRLPESPGVENAPYPSLADAPDPVPPINLREPENELPARRRGAAVTAEMLREAERLRAEARRLDQEQAGERRVTVSHNQRAAEDLAGELAEEEASIKAADVDEAARLRAEIEAELDAAFGAEDGAPASE